jgi:lipopolysaccharide export system permease protein
MLQSILDVTGIIIDMLIKKFFFYELVSNASKILIVLACILPFTELFKLLDQINSGSIPLATLFIGVIYATIGSFPMILTIACFLSVSITISRYCRDNEFIIWLSAAVSPFYWLRQVLIFIIPMALICAICTLYITPWAHKKSNEYMVFLLKQKIVNFIAPGVFRENHNFGQTFYIEKYSLSMNQIEKIFFQYMQNGKLYNLTADSGHINSNHDILSISLNNGCLYSVRDDDVLINFKKFTAAIPNYTDNDFTLTKNKASILHYLYTSYNDLIWQISIPLMMILMTMLVVPISIQTGRIQNSLIFIASPLLYTLYENILLSLIGQLNNHPKYFYLICATHIIIASMAIILTYHKAYPRGLFRVIKC